MSDINPGLDDTSGDGGTVLRVQGPIAHTLMTVDAVQVCDVGSEDGGEPLRVSILALERLLTMATTKVRVKCGACQSTAIRPSHRTKDRRVQ